MKRFTWKPYKVTAWQKAALEALRPPESITVSQWAERRRILNERSAAMPGKWRNSVTPYLTGIMDAFSDYQTEEIVFCKPTQVGGTTAMENMIGYLIEQDPAATMVVYPSDALAESTSENRLEPMLLDCPELRRRYRQHDSTKLELQFENMYITLTGANSPADLASKPIRYLFMDEVDKYPGASKKEADPVSLAQERTKTFFNRKIVKCSTPTLKTGHIWKAKEAADVEKHYFVPCPHCAAYIELKFAQLKWPDKESVPENADRAEMAMYVCQDCGSIITDQDKPKMLREGQWRPVKTSAARPKSVAFWMNTMYSPFVRFSEVAKEFMRSKDDPDLLHNFTNSWLAEPWEDTKLKTNADMVMERQTEMEMFAVPDWAKLLTGGVDVQENCLYWTIRAWGDYITSQNIAHGQAYSLTEVMRVMDLSYRRPDGVEMMVDLVLIDSGDQTDEVYDFCAQNSQWALPCKGVGSQLSHYRLSTVNKAGSKAYGMNLVLVDGGKYKDMIAGRMKKPNGNGSWMVYKDCDLEYAEQVTAEHKVTERRGGKETQVWQKKTTHAANHYLDAEVYCMAAADVLGVRSLYLQTKVDGEGKDVQKAPAKTQAPPPPAEESWIQQKDNWI